MTTSKSLLKVFLLLVFVFIVGCATSPSTGKKVFSIISEPEEIALAKQAYGPIIQASGGKYHNGTVEEYIYVRGCGYLP